MQQMNGLDYKIREMAARIRDLREIVGLTAEEMARKTDVTVEEYLRCEQGEQDLNFAFIYRCAQVLGVNVTDIIEGVSLELSRLLYGIGLLLAGVVSDRNRRYGALCCAGALVTPFLMLALSGAAAPATLLWALGYLLFGFFSVFRVLLLADLSSAARRPDLSGLGMLFGRVGDALGTVLYVALAGAPLVLIVATSVLFACSIMLFFVLYQRAYTPTIAVEEPSEHEVFERFATRHDLSAREREVLRLVLEEQSNGQIATTLFVSEATVKFHVRNLLRKTGCHNRREVIALYHS